MGLTYQFGFELEVDAAGFALDITRGAYTYDTINVASLLAVSSGYFYPGIGDGAGYDDFAGKLASAIAAEAVAQGDPLAAFWAVSWSHANSAYTIANTSDTWSATLSVDAQHVLGMAGTLTTNNIQTSTVRPYYVIRPALDSFKSEGPDYEPDSAAPDEEETDDGDAASVVRETMPIYHDLMQLWEPRAACEPLSASASVPWTWKHAVQHARATHPFILLIAPNTQSTVSYVAADVWARLKLRGGAAVWKSQRAIARPSPLDTYRHIPLRCRVLERLSD